jgi:hypothetical protein
MRVWCLSCLNLENLTIKLELYLTCMNVHTFIETPAAPLLVNSKLLVRTTEDTRKRLESFLLLLHRLHHHTKKSTYNIGHVTIYYCILYVHFWPAHIPFRLVIFSPPLTRWSKATVITRHSDMIAGPVDRSTPKLALIWPYYWFWKWNHAPRHNIIIWQPMMFLRAF